MNLATILASSSRDPPTSSGNSLSGIWSVTRVNAFAKPWMLPKEMPALVKDHESKGRYIKLKDDSSVFVCDQGKTNSTSQTTVVMIHGVPASSFLYRKFFDGLGYGRRGLAKVFRKGRG